MAESYIASVEIQGPSGASHPGMLPLHRVAWMPRASSSSPQAKAGSPSVNIYPTTPAQALALRLDG